MNKNLLVITDGYPDIRNNRANCQFVFEYVNLAKNFFNHVYVISPQPYFPKILNYFTTFKKYSRLSNFENYHYDNVEVFYPNFFTLPITVFRSSNWTRFLKSIRKIIKDNSLNFDLIHAHFVNPSGQAAVYLKNDYSVKLIVTPHGTDIYSWPYKNKNNFGIAKHVLQEADIVTIHSEVIDKHVRKIYPPVKEKIKRVSNFVDLDKFKILNKEECRKNLQLPLEKKIIIAIGNLIKSKGFQDLLEIFPKILASYPNMLLYIIGEGKLKDQLNNQIDNLGLKDKALLVGGVPNNILPKWYNAADLFVFPSYQESFGIVQVEAAACGLPIVAYDNDGSKSIITPDLGSLAKKGDKEDLKKKIIYYLENQKKSNRHSARQYIEDNFSSLKSQKDLVAVYESLLEKS